MDFAFFFSSIIFGVALAMDAFSVSLANGALDHKMSKAKPFIISGTFAFFQALMPFIGWFFVHTIVEYFVEIQKFIPYVALLFLLIIGIKMIVDGAKGENVPCSIKIGAISLLVQGLATSIDALSVGFNIQNYTAIMALTYSLIIGVVTFAVCLLGVVLGKKIGNKLSCRASIFGGTLLIVIGICIFIKGIL